MSLKKAIIGGLAFGVPGFVAGSLLDDKPKKARIKRIIKNRKETIEEKYSEYLDDDTFINFAMEWSQDIIGKSLEDINDWTDDEFEEMINVYEEEKCREYQY